MLVDNMASLMRQNAGNDIIIIGKLNHFIEKNDNIAQIGIDQFDCIFDDCPRIIRLLP